MPGHRPWTPGTDSTSGSSGPGDSAASRVARDEHTNKRARPEFAAFIPRSSPPRPTILATPHNSILHVGLVKTHGGRCLPSALEFAPVQLDNIVFHFPLPPFASTPSASSDVEAADSVVESQAGLDDHKSIAVVTTSLDDLPPDYTTLDHCQAEQDRGRQMSTTPGLSSRRALSEPKFLENPCPCSRDRGSSRSRVRRRESLQELKARLETLVPESEDHLFEQPDSIQPLNLGTRKRTNSKPPIKTVSYQSVCSTGPVKKISYQSLCPSGEPIDQVPIQKPSAPNGFQRRQSERQRLGSFDTMRDLPIAADFKRSDSEIERLFGHHTRNNLRDHPIPPAQWFTISKADRILGESVVDSNTQPRPSTSASKADRIFGEIGTIHSAREGRPNIPHQRSSTTDVSASDSQSMFSVRRRTGSATKHTSSYVQRVPQNEAQTLWKPSDLWKPNAKIDRAATVDNRTSVTIHSPALAKKLGVGMGIDVGLERGNRSRHDMGSFARHARNEAVYGNPYAIIPEVDKAFSMYSLDEETVDSVQNLRRMGLLLEGK